EEDGRGRGGTAGHAGPPGGRPSGSAAQSGACLGEDDDQERTAILRTARQATDTALGVLTALGAAPGPHRLELLRDSVRAAHGTVESGKTAVHRSTGTRLG
ncbi:hypothetical protein, partial [Kitasatospora sp. NPDC001225]